MKYDVRFSCGHNEEIQIYGANVERERKIAYFEKYGLCSCCFRELKEIEKKGDCEEVEMPYSEYKSKYADRKTKSGSYNAIGKTIIVYV